MSAALYYQKTKKTFDPRDVFRLSFYRWKRKVVVLLLMCNFLKVTIHFVRGLKILFLVFFYHRGLQQSAFSCVLLFFRWSVASWSSRCSQTNCRLLVFLQKLRHWPRQPSGFNFTSGFCDGATGIASVTSLAPCLSDVCHYLCPPHPLRFALWELRVWPPVIGTAPHRWAAAAAAEAGAVRLLFDSRGVPPLLLNCRLESQDWN